MSSAIPAAIAGIRGTWYEPVATTTCSATSAPADVRRENRPSGSAATADDRHALADGQGEGRRVAGEVGDPLVARLEAVGLGPLVGEPGEAVEPVGQDHARGVPATSPGLPDPAALEDDVVEPALGEL